MDPPSAISARRFAHVTRSVQREIKKSMETPTEQGGPTPKEKRNRDVGGGRGRLRAARRNLRRADVAMGFGERQDSEESAGSESPSSVDTEIVGGVGGNGSPWFVEPEPVRRRSRGRPKTRINPRSPALQSRRRNDASGSRERLSLGESSSRRMSEGVKRKSESMDQEYEIEDILDKYVDRDGMTWYLILWKNYEKHESTWEPRGKLEPDGMEAVQDFENRAQQMALREGQGEVNGATDDIGDGGGVSDGRRSQINRFRNTLWQTSVDIMYGVITTTVTVALIGVMAVLAYSYAEYYSHDDD